MRRSEEAARAWVCERKKKLSKRDRGILEDCWRTGRRTEEEQPWKRTLLQPLEPATSSLLSLSFVVIRMHPSGD